MHRTAIALLTLAGCIDEFRGSNVQIDFAQNMPVQASPYRAASPEEFPANIHFTLYAFTTTGTDNMVVGHLFEIQKFEIQRIIDLLSPCYIDVGERVPFPGLHVSEYAARIAQSTGIDDIANPPAGATEEQKIDAATAIQRQSNVELLAGEGGPKVVTSASTNVYANVAADCTDTSGIPPPQCTGDAENALRLQKCQAAWGADGDYYEGTDRVLTDPLNGVTYGFVVGMNPVNLAPVGGAQFFVNENLEDFEAFAIYWQYDDANGDGQPDYPPTVPMDERTALGELYLYGTPEAPTRGVIHVHLTSLVSPVTAELAIFANIDEDEVHF